MWIPQGFPQVHCNNTTQSNSLFNLMLFLKHTCFYQLSLSQTLSVHVVQAINNKVDISNALTVFFLHGAKFSSQNWVDIHTLEHVANWGYRAIAIDLPGRGSKRGRPKSIGSVINKNT